MIILGQQDYLTKEYVSDSRVFADVFNFFLFHGKDTIRPEQLSELDSTLLHVPGEDIPSGKAFERQRDLVRLLRLSIDGTDYLFILGIELQTHLHYAMPVRDLFYTSLQYSHQLTDIANRHQTVWKRGASALVSSDNKITKAEFLSRFTKEDRIIPVINLVIYFGADPWDAPRSLHDMMTSPLCPDMIPDYHIHLLAPACIEDSDFSRFRTGIREILLYIKYSKDKHKLLQLMKEDIRFHSLDWKTASVILALTGDHIPISKEQEEGINMCQAIEELLEDSRMDGIALGRIEGHSAGLIEGRSAGLNEGRTAGLKEGHSVGLTEGLETGLAIMQILTCHPDYPDSQIAEEAGCEEEIVCAYRQVYLGRVTS